MNLAPMSYQDYIWPLNPETIRVQRIRNTAEFQIPQQSAAVQDNGSAPRKISGNGRFTGSSCMDEFSKLAAVFAAGGSGLLRLPGAKPFYAIFSVLTMKGKARPNCVEYEFSFLEDASHTAKGGTALTQAYLCSGGENLWEIANRYGTDVDTLRTANPQVEWPNNLPAGMEVAVP